MVEIVSDVLIDGVRANQGLKGQKGLKGDTGQAPDATLTVSNFSDVSYTSSNTDAQVIHSFATTAYKGIKWVIELESGADRETVEIAAIHDDTTATSTEYARVATNASLGTFSVAINTGNVELTATPTNAVTTFNIFQIGITG